MSSSDACTRSEVLCLIRPSASIQNPYHPCLQAVLTRNPALLENYRSATATVESINRPMRYQVLFCDHFNYNLCPLA